MGRADQTFLWVYQIPIIDVSNAGDLFIDIYFYQSALSISHPLLLIEEPIMRNMSLIKCPIYSSLTDPPLEERSSPSGPIYLSIIKCPESPLFPIYLLLSALFKKEVPC